MVHRNQHGEYSTTGPNKDRAVLIWHHRVAVFANWVNYMTCYFNLKVLLRMENGHQDYMQQGNNDVEVKRPSHHHQKLQKSVSFKEWYHQTIMISNVLTKTNPWIEVLHISFPVAPCFKGTPYQQKDPINWKCNWDIHHKWNIFTFVYSTK